MKSKKQELVHRSLLVILVLIFFAVGSQAAEKFYVIAHMVNDARTAGKCLFAYIVNNLLTRKAWVFVPMQHWGRFSEQVV